MTSLTPSEGPSPSPRQLLKILHDKYPVFREYRPLSIGIDKQILAENPELDRKVLRIALSIHSSSTAYLKSVARTVSRYQLNGEASGEVAEAHRNWAGDLLAERYTKLAEQRKAKREADMAERRRADKLRQLADKFAKK